MQRILIGNIKGPQGAQGIQGPQGPVGATGPQGPMPDLVNNALATEAGVAALDAVMGKTLQDQITQLNSKLSIKSTTVTKTTDEFGFVSWGDVLPTGSKTVNVIVSSTDALVAFNGNSYGYVYRSNSATDPLTRLRNTSVDLTITYQ